MKKMLSVALAAALVLGMAGCGGAGAPETAATEAATTATEAAKESETTAAGSTEAQKAPEQSEGGKKAAMITAQPLGDKGVTDNTYEGFKRGCEEFGYEPTVVGFRLESMRKRCVRCVRKVMTLSCPAGPPWRTPARRYPQSTRTASLSWYSARSSFPM